MESAAAERKSNSPIVTKESDKRLGFKFVWPVKVHTRQLNPNDPTSFTILHVSPKFVTAHGHVSFQWTIKLCATENLVEESDDDCPAIADNSVLGSGKRKDENDYVAISLYYCDGPTASVELKAKIKVMAVANPPSSDSHHVHPGSENRLLIDDGKRLSVFATRGRECEIPFEEQSRFSDYIKQHVGRLVHLSLFLEMDASMFCTDSYLNAASPTLIHSFLVQNYGCRTSTSKVWETTRHLSSRPRSASDGQPGCNVEGKKIVDLERLFNKVIDEERERRELLQLRADIVGLELSRTETADRQMQVADGSCVGSTGRTTHVERPKLSVLIPQFSFPDQHLFKKLLIACCDSCGTRLCCPRSLKDRRASVALPSSQVVHRGLLEALKSGNSFKLPRHRDRESWTEWAEPDLPGGDESESEEVCAFECSEERKREMHDILANMFFNRVALPAMEYVEDFADFLIDAEINELPVLKRACERYLCSELNTRSHATTALMFEFYFLSMVFELPVLKSMALMELCGRHEEIGDADAMLEYEEYKNLDKRIRQLCDRNLSDLLDECKRFREQRNRVHVFNVS